MTVGEAQPGLSGYADPRYVTAFSEVGIPCALPRSGGWVLSRKIPGGHDRDAAGCYPLFTCARWSELHEDIEELRSNGFVSLTLVSDPFSAPGPESLGGTFGMVRPFKTHFVADLHRARTSVVSVDHQRCARSAFNRGVRVIECDEPLRHLDHWMTLYERAMASLHVPMHRRYSRASMEIQLCVRGACMLRAETADGIVGYGIFLLSGDVAYAHLTAYAPEARRSRASCAMYWTAMEVLADRVRWIDWGGNAGVVDDHASSLASFKRGWASEARVAYLCGSVLDEGRYQQLARESGYAGSEYFPAYRAGES